MYVYIYIYSYDPKKTSGCFLRRPRGPSAQGPIGPPWGTWSFAAARRPDVQDLPAIYGTNGGRMWKDVEGDPGDPPCDAPGQ